jgi:hypothetical protein
VPVRRAGGSETQMYSPIEKKEEIQINQHDEIKRKMYNEDQAA